MDPLEKAIAEINLAKFNAEFRRARHGSVREVPEVKLANGAFLILEPPPVAVDAGAMANVKSSLEALVEFIAVFIRVTRDELLSERGKAERLKQPRLVAVQALAVWFENHLTQKARVAKAREDRFAPPTLSTSAGPPLDIALSYDREIRDRVMAMTREEQLHLLEVICDGTAPETVVNAILRDPMGAAEPLFLGATEAHQRLINLRDPGGLAVLQTAEESLEWAERQMFIIASHLLRFVGLDRQAVAQLLAGRKGGGWQVYGFAAQEVAQAAQLNDAERQIAEARQASRAA